MYVLLQGRWSLGQRLQGKGDRFNAQDLLGLRLGQRLGVKHLLADEPGTKLLVLGVDVLLANEAVLAPLDDGAESLLLAEFLRESLRSVRACICQRV